MIHFHRDWLSINPVTNSICIWFITSQHVHDFARDRPGESQLEGTVDQIATQPVRIDIFAYRIANWRIDVQNLLPSFQKWQSIRPVQVAVVCWSLQLFPPSTGGRGWGRVLRLSGPHKRRNLSQLCRDCTPPPHQHPHPPTTRCLVTVQGKLLFAYWYLPV